MFHEMNLLGSPFERVSASPLCIPVHNIEYFHSAVGGTCGKPFSVVVELRIVLILGVNCGGDQRLERDLRSCLRAQSQ